MKKKSVVKNYIYNLIYQVAAIILPILTTPYLSRVLGAEKIGIYSYTLSIVTYFILIGSLGVNLYGQKEIAYCQNNKEERSYTFFEIFFMKCVTLSISMIIFYFVFALNGEYSVYYKILLLEIFANIIDISWFFQGMEEFKKTVTRNMIVKIISTILIFVLIKKPEDLFKYFLIYVLSTLIGNATLWFYLPKFVIKINMKKMKITRHLKPTIVLFIPQIATQIYTVLDKTMIGSMISEKSEVGYYEQSQKIVKLLLTIITSLGTVMLPRVSNYFVNKEFDKIKKSIYESFKFTFFIGIPIMLGIISVAKSFVPIFFGDGYDKVVIIIQIISAIVILIGITNIIGAQYLLPVKREKEYTISVIAGAVVNVVFNYVLIKKYMSVGAAVATVLSEGIVTIIQVYSIKNEFDILEIIKNIKNYIWSGIAMFIVSTCCQFFIKTGLKCLIIQIALGAITYIVILILAKDEMIQKLFNIMKKRVKKEGI